MAAEAYILLSVPHATLATPTATHAGTLDLEAVALGPGHAFLVLRLAAFEAPVDPARAIDVAPAPGAHGARTYTLRATPFDPDELVLTIAPPPGARADAELAETLDTLEAVLAQFADLRTGGPSPLPLAPTASAAAPAPPPAAPALPAVFPPDLHGRLVLVNEASGEVVGEFDHRLAVREDPALGAAGHERDPVFIELPTTPDGAKEGKAALEPDDAPRAVFARAVPPGEQDWITRSAAAASSAITLTTRGLLAGITAASALYIAHAAPSPHHPASAARAPGPPPRVLAALTGARAHAGLAGAHRVSGHAVQVSARTVAAIDGLIRRAVGGAGGAGAGASAGGASGPGEGKAIAPPPLPPRTPSPAPPAYYPGDAGAEKGAAPPLPPRTQSGPPGGVGVASGSGGAEPGLSGAPLTTKARLLLSADLVLSTLDASARELLDVGGARLADAVGHKYGPDAAHSTRLATGTARNLALVYVDVRGVGRTALLRRAGKEFVKGRVAERRA